MNFGTVQVVATLKAKEGKREELTAILLDLVADTREEKGCIKYELLLNNADKTEFVFVEEWTTDAALDAHLKSAHLQSARAKAAQLLAQEPDIRRYSLVA
jgi:quinol monooxygenase YgiN